MLLHPAWNTIFRRQAPKATLLDLKKSTGNSTSYSFTDVNLRIGSNGSFATESLASGSADGAYPHTESEYLLAIIVHQLDSATVFGVNSVTFGGVPLTETIDIGPSANLSNTAMYWTTGAALADIATRTVVVTPSESITGCAIAVVGISNFGAAQTRAVGSSTGNGGMPINIGSADIAGPNYFVLGGLTCVGGTQENLIWNHMDGDGPLAGLELLYEDNTTEFSLAGYFAHSRQYIGIPPTSPGYVNTDWSGAGDGSHAITLWQS